MLERCSVELIRAATVQSPGPTLTLSSSELTGDADASGLGGRALQRRRAATPGRLLLPAAQHQLADQDPLQAAIVHPLTQPAAAGEPGEGQRDGNQVALRWTHASREMICEGQTPGLG